MNNVVRSALLADEGMSPSERLRNPEPHLNDHTCGDRYLLADGRGDQVLQAAPVNKLHRHMETTFRQANLEDVHDVRMPQLRTETGFVKQTVRRLLALRFGREELESDRLLKVPVRLCPRTPDLA